MGRTPNKFYKDWPYHWAPKDMRRASLYHLGHYTPMTTNQMLKQARQKSEKSLRLYLRRADETLKEYSEICAEDMPA